MFLFLLSFSFALGSFIDDINVILEIEIICRIFDFSSNLGLDLLSREEVMDTLDVSLILVVLPCLPRTDDFAIGKCKSGYGK